MLPKNVKLQLYVVKASGKDVLNIIAKYPPDCWTIQGKVVLYIVSTVAPPLAIKEEPNVSTILYTFNPAGAVAGTLQDDKIQSYLYPLNVVPT